MPLSSLSIQTDIFVTVSNEDFWEGFVVVSIDMENDEVNPQAEKKPVAV